VSEGPSFFQKYWVPHRPTSSPAQQRLPTDSRSEFSLRSRTRLRARLETRLFLSDFFHGTFCFMKWSSSPTRGSRRPLPAWAQFPVRFPGNLYSSIWTKDFLFNQRLHLRHAGSFPPQMVESNSLVALTFLPCFLPCAGQGGTFSLDKIFRAALGMTPLLFRLPGE